MLANSQLRNSLHNFFSESAPNENAIRPASVDLSVGDIVVPPKKGSDKATSVSSSIIPIGGTLVVETAETLKIPATHAGLMFPKSSALAEKGILITNFGCVDPGYIGKLKFIVINLGRKQFSIRKNDKVVTLTLFRLEDEANPDYQEYSKDRPNSLTISETSKMLAHDFVHVEKRAVAAAKETIRKSTVWFGFILSMTLVIPTLIIALAPPFLERWYSYGATDYKIEEIDQRINAKVTNLEKEIAKLNTTIINMAAEND